MNMANNGEGETARSIRELGGEIYAELSYRIGEEVNSKPMHKIVDIVMGVFARYAPQIIRNDERMPVEPLPEWTFRPNAGPPPD